MGSLHSTSASSPEEWPLTVLSDSVDDDEEEEVGDQLYRGDVRQGDGGGGPGEGFGEAHASSSPRRPGPGRDSEDTLGL